MSKTFPILIISVLILSTSLVAVSFIPWTLNDQALLIYVHEGDLTCSNGVAYDELYSLHSTIYREDGTSDMDNPFFFLTDKDSGVRALSGYIVKGEVVSDEFQIEAFITDSSCENFQPYTVILEGTCNLEKDTEVIYDISGNEIIATLSSVTTACTTS